MLKVNNHFSNYWLQFELKLRTYIVIFLIKVGKYNKVFNRIYKAWKIRCGCKTRNIKDQSLRTQLCYYGNVCCLSHHLFGSLSTDFWEIDEANIEMLPLLCVNSEHGVTSASIRRNKMFRMITVRSMVMELPI